ncbi:MAG TPA: (2Fe-2S)-binding protein [Edaphocola sp.]|nr:(2Fe-2S)-binding protein [Edaphocola sp.]
MPSKIVCNCNLVTVKEIEKVMTKGYLLFEDVSKITGASKSCGRCKPNLQRLIDQHISSMAAWQTVIDWNLITTSNNQEDNE